MMIMMTMIMIITIITNGLFKLVVYKAERSNCFSINLLIGQKGCTN